MFFKYYSFRQNLLNDNIQISLVIWNKLFVTSGFCKACQTGGHVRGQRIITLSQNIQNMDPLPPCSQLFDFGNTLTLLSNIQNLTSTPPPPPPPPLTKPFFDFIVLWRAVISSFKYHKKNAPWAFPKFTRIQMVLIIRDDLRVPINQI